MKWEIGFDGDTDECLLIIPLKTFDKDEAKVKAKKYIQSFDKKVKDNEKFTTQNSRPE